MGLLDIFRRAEKEKKVKTTSAEAPTKIEEICEGDHNTYEALLSTMFLDPRRIDVSLSDAAKRARDFEREKDLLRARFWYEIAGGLAIYKGDVSKVIEYFEKCEEVSPKTSYAILKNPKKAVAVAQEYYKRYLKEKS